MKHLTMLFLAVTVFANGQIIQFSDPFFKAKLLAASTTNFTAKNESSAAIAIDLNANNEIEVSEALGVYQLNLFASSISDITGINYFSNVKALILTQNVITSADITELHSLELFQCMNNQMATLNASNLVHLKTLFCYDNELTSLNVTGCTDLETLNCENNYLTSLDLTGLDQLRQLECYENQLTSLDVNHLHNLTTLYCYRNDLTTLDLSGLSNLFSFSCVENQITSLNLSGLSSLYDLAVRDNLLTSLEVSDMTSLVHLNCYNNDLTTLDCSNLGQLSYLNCFNNALTSLYIKNGSIENSVSFSGNPNLQFICVDTPQITTITNAALQNGNPSCVVDDICALSTNTFDLVNRITIVPNPVSDYLKIESEFKFKSIWVYNNVSNLNAGIYFIKGNTGQGAFNAQFVKN